MDTIRLILYAVVPLTLTAFVLNWTIKERNGLEPEGNWSEKLSRQEQVDEAMRKGGMCRWWMLVHDLPDRAYERLDQIPDFKLRMNMLRTCPESQPGFIGPQEATYFEDRNRWKKEWGKYPEWKH